MAKTENYADILNRSWDDIPKTKLLPDGSYLLKGRNVGMFPPREEGQSTRVAFFYEPREAMDDVSPEALAALGDDYSLSENDIVKQFFINRNKDWDAVRKHLALHGIDTDGKTQAETFDAFKGTEVVAFVGTKTYVNGRGETVVDNEPQSFEKLS